MTYTKQNLPTRFLKPPVKPTDPLAEEFWDRNWSIFAIATQWGDNPHGMLTAIANWAHQVDPAEKKITRQRVQAIVHAMAWKMRDYSSAELGFDNEVSAAGMRK
jgi:hypothetical protein